MTEPTAFRWVLMSSDVRDGTTGFHRFGFKIDGGRVGMSEVTVQISVDAHRKVVSQLSRARMLPNDRADKAALLKRWAIWDVGNRYRENGFVPKTITITASDVDEFGAYATDLGRSLKSSA